jgi:hypothetical protein
VSSTNVGLARQNAKGAGGLCVGVIFLGHRFPVNMETEKKSKLITFKDEFWSTFRRRKMNRSVNSAPRSHLFRPPFSCKHGNRKEVKINNV